MYACHGCQAHYFLNHLSRVTYISYHRVKGRFAARVQAELTLHTDTCRQTEPTQAQKGQWI